MIMEETKTEKRFAGLSNEEIVLVHEKFSSYLQEINANLAENKVHQKVKTPHGEAVRVHKLTDSQVNEFKNSEYYKLSNSIVTKLSPIVEIIRDGQPDALKNLSK